MEVIEESRLRCIRLALPLRAPEWAAVSWRIRARSLKTSIDPLA